MTKTFAESCFLLIVAPRGCDGNFVADAISANLPPLPSGGPTKVFEVDAALLGGKHGKVVDERRFWPKTVIDGAARDARDGTVRAIFVTHTSAPFERFESADLPTCQVIYVTRDPFDALLDLRLRLEGSGRLWGSLADFALDYSLLSYRDSGRRKTNATYLAWQAARNVAYAHKTGGYVTAYEMLMDKYEDEMASLLAFCGFQPPRRLRDIRGYAKASRLKKWFWGPFAPSVAAYSAVKSGEGWRTMVEEGTPAQKVAHVMAQLGSAYDGKKGAE